MREGFFEAITVEFGDGLKNRREESAETRIPLMRAVYCLKVSVRWLHQRIIGYALII